MYIKNNLYKVHILFFFFFLKLNTDKNNRSGCHRRIILVGIYSNWRLFLLVFLLLSSLRQHFLVDIQSIDPRILWRTANRVLRNGFNKTITRVNWAFAECFDPIPPKIQLTRSAANPIRGKKWF